MLQLASCVLEIVLLLPACCVFFAHLSSSRASLEGKFGEYFVLLVDGYFWCVGRIIEDFLDDFVASPPWKEN